MAKFEKHEGGEAGEAGWSRWVFPTQKSDYKLACCDCGLVHNVQFKIARVSRESKNGAFTEKKIIKQKMLRVKFKVSRNNRSTAQIRRHMKKT